jgi:hypothetical protein
MATTWEALLEDCGVQIPMAEIQMRRSSASSLHVAMQQTYRLASNPVSRAQTSTIFFRLQPPTNGNNKKGRASLWPLRNSQNSIQPDLESGTIYNLLLLQAVGTQQMATTREELLSGNAWTCHKSTQKTLQVLFMWQAMHTVMELHP